MPNEAKGLARAQVRPSERDFLAEVACEVREHMAVLGGAGWSLWDIAAALSCGRTALWSWRTGAGDMPSSKLKKLRALAAEVAARKAGSL